MTGAETDVDIVDGANGALLREEATITANLEVTSEALGLEQDLALGYVAHATPPFVDTFFFESSTGTAAPTEGSCSQQATKRPVSSRVLSGGTC